MENNLINLIDCPGYFDFIGQTFEAIKVIDGAILLFDPKQDPSCYRKIIEELEKANTCILCNEQNGSRKYRLF